MDTPQQHRRTLRRHDGRNGWPIVIFFARQPHLQKLGFGPAIMRESFRPAAIGLGERVTKQNELDRFVGGQSPKLLETGDATYLITHREHFASRFEQMRVGAEAEKKRFAEQIGHDPIPGSRANISLGAEVRI